MTSLKTIELKFLLKLLGCRDYRGKVVDLSPSSKTSAAERDRICQSLGAEGLVEYSSEIAKFSIAPPGKTLLSLDTTSLPVTPDEMKVLQACKGTMTPGKLGKQIPANERQNLIASLADRGMLKIVKNTMKEVWLSAQGKQFLINEYEPKGNSLAATATMLGNYVNFLRENLGQPGEAHLPVGQPSPQKSLSQPGSDSAMPIGAQSKPDAGTVLQQIKQLDQLTGSDNYLPIYHLREKLQPPLTREELDSCLYALQRDDRIELSSLHDQGNYSDYQVSAGIPQNHGRSLFFISVI
ncbi:MAG: hypothetical protein WBA76_05725 [Phormidesmis sp.]